MPVLARPHQLDMQAFHQHSRRHGGWAASPPMASTSAYDWQAWFMLCCADMSTCWPTPETVWRSHRAIRAAPAASEAALWKCLWKQAPGAQRRPVGIAGHHHVHRRGLQREVRDCPLRLGPVRAERRDRHVHQLRIDLRQGAVAQPQGIHPARPGRLDHDVGRGSQVPQLGRALVGRQIQHHAALAPVVGPVMQRTLGILNITSKGGQPPRRRPLRRLHGDHVGTHLGEDRPAQVTPLVGEVQHPERAQHRRGREIRHRDDRSAHQASAHFSTTAPGLGARQSAPYQRRSGRILASTDAPAAASRTYA